MALRAVIFDFGMVLTAAPDQEAHDAMVRITGLSADRFESLYWADRHAYDEGKLTGVAFWQKFIRDAKLDHLGEDGLHELNRLDARMWTTHNPAMVAWQLQLKQHGIRTGILSNMGDSVLASIQKEFKWLERFDVLIWSYQLNMAKPDPKIYLHTLEQLGMRPEETLFLDDRRINVDAAIALGMKSLEFSTVDRLRSDLVANGFDSDLPLPA
ncbi:MAG TPA: HAD family phosphatase [Terracidiphilus sp.]|nr:HAD family phosphatase [Terracidiphilus sp.]